MRKILFRAKAINRDSDGNYRTSYQNGDWVYGLLTALPNEHFGFPAKMRNVAGISGIEVDYKTLGQYTGMDDKNGVPIFEGDIVKVDDDYDTFGKMAGEIREVWFKDGGFRLKPRYTSSIARGDRGYWLEDGVDYEVIGNVHDNPELIGGSSNE